MKRLTIRKAIVLAGGAGTRLHPLTKVTSKQLLPLYNKPVVMYPLQTLKEMGYEDILIINATYEQQNNFKILLGDGHKFQLNLSYALQDTPRGLVDAFIIGRDFLKDADEICLILGDNVIVGTTPKKVLPNTIFTYKVRTPEKYGVVSLNGAGSILEIAEKPARFVSDDAIIGLYVFSRAVLEEAPLVVPSERGELEIVDLIKRINAREKVNVVPLEGLWFDVGDFDSLLDCANLIRTINDRGQQTIGLSEETIWH